MADIIGVVQELVNVPSSSGAKKVVVDVNLKDLRGNVIPSRLWEIYATKDLQIIEI